MSSIGKKAADLSSLMGSLEQPSESKYKVLPIGKIISKEQVRKQFNLLDELAESIKEHGIQSPIIVSGPNEKGLYTIEKGERRWRAANIANLTEVPVLVEERPSSIIDEVAGELVENIQRDDLMAMEIAEALKKLSEQGLTQVEIGRKLGKPKGYVSAHLGLLKSPECVMKLYDDGITNDTETINTLRLLYDINPDRCEEVCKLATETGMSRALARSILNDEKTPGASEKKPDKKKSKAPELEPGHDLPPGEEEGMEDAPDNDHGEIINENMEIPSTNSDEPEDSGQAENAVQNETLPTEDEDEDQVEISKAGGEFVTVQPSDLIITVVFTVESKGHTEQRKGILVTNRACKDPRMIYVKVLEGSKEKFLKIEAAEVIISTIERMGQK